MATIQEMLAYDTLLSGDMMRRKTAMGNEIRPGEGSSPYQPYKPKEPTGPFVPAPGKKKKDSLAINQNNMTDEDMEELDEDETYGDPSEFPRNEDLMISQGFVKNVGEPMGIMSATEGMKIIDDTETNPLKKELRRMRMFRSNPIDPGLGSV